MRNTESEMSRDHRHDRQCKCDNLVNRHQIFLAWLMTILSVLGHEHPIRMAHEEL